MDALSDLRRADAFLTAALCCVEYAAAHLGGARKSRAGELEDLITEAVRHGLRLRNCVEGDLRAKLDVVGG